jgi:hypothetical protein
MNRRCLSGRIFALLAAYVFALQVVLASFVLTAHPAAEAPLSASILCTTTPGEFPPTGQDQVPCVLHCLMLCATSTGLPPPAAVAIALVSPREFRVSQHESFSGPRHAARAHPHNPRAPPRA